MKRKGVLGKTTLFYCKSKPILAAFEPIAFAEEPFYFSP
jgi:hypothetical protein